MQFAIDELSTFLAVHLPTKIDVALTNNLDHLATNLVQRLQQDLAVILPTSGFSMLAQCHTQLLELNGNRINQASLFSQNFIIPDLAHTNQYAKFSMNCTPNWLNIMVLPIFLTSTLLYALLRLPTPLSAQQQRWFTRFIDSQLGHNTALQCARDIQPLDMPEDSLLEQLFNMGNVNEKYLAQLSRDARFCQLHAEQLPWLHLALSIPDATIEHAFAVALSPSTLDFYLANGDIKIHGLAIKLPQTPLFYYYWYAQLRHHPLDPLGEGWFGNPASHRSDPFQAQVLIQLMQQFQGSSKAIADLQEHGLRGKILDQNRNKLKAKLVEILGEELAKPYLFEAQRDMKTARFKYRLALPAYQINLN
ncbi:hypothetical protein [Shewanella baltica]|uniref:hypothetical protein n=1 Tax=Shewanella baltica TaxID=62322 RepID=UPI00217EFAC0|nr:hypothetical protein [Shewanella baltica]MCS6211587.1 hypothetical protein [Shewanella baltica]